MSPLLFLFLFSEDALAVAAGSSGGGGHVRTAGGQQSAQRQQRQQRQLHPSGPPGPGRPGPSKAALLSPGSADSRLPHLRGLGDRERPLCCAFWGDPSEAFFFLLWMLWTGRGLEAAREEGLLFPAAQLP